MGNGNGAFEDGFDFAQNWVGPNGDGSFGNLSMEFIKSQIPNDFADHLGEWWDGFWNGVDAIRHKNS